LNELSLLAKLIWAEYSTLHRQCSRTI